MVVFSTFPLIIFPHREQGDAQKAEAINLPVYLNSHRSDLLFTVDMKVAQGQSAHQFYERGVALLASTSL